MLRKFVICLSTIIPLLLVISSSSLALNETEKEKIKDIVPPGFPINNETEVEIENGTVWVKTPIDLNNWSFPDPEEMISWYTHSKEMDELSKDIEKSQNELEKVLEDLEKTKENIKRFGEIQHRLEVSLVIALGSFMILSIGVITVSYTHLTLPTKA